MYIWEAGWRARFTHTHEIVHLPCCKKKIAQSTFDLFGVYDIIYWWITFSLLSLRSPFSLLAIGIGKA